jgi:hypothetical protein
VLLLCMEMESILRGSFVSLASKGYPNRCHTPIGIAKNATLTPALGRVSLRRSTRAGLTGLLLTNAVVRSNPLLNRAAIKYQSPAIGNATHISRPMYFRSIVQRLLSCTLRCSLLAVILAIQNEVHSTVDGQECVEALLQSKAHHRVAINDFSDLTAKAVHFLSHYAYKGHYHRETVNVRVVPTGVAIDESVELAHEIYNRVFRKVPERVMQK